MFPWHDPRKTHLCYGCWRAVFRSRYFPAAIYDGTYKSASLSLYRQVAMILKKRTLQPIVQSSSNTMEAAQDKQLSVDTVPKPPPRDPNAGPGSSVHRAATSADRPPPYEPVSASASSKQASPTLYSPQSSPQSPDTLPVASGSRSFSQSSSRSPPPRHPSHSITPSPSTPFLQGSISMASTSSLSERPSQQRSASVSSMPKGNSILTPIAPQYINKFSLFSKNSPISGKSHQDLLLHER